MKDKNYNVRLDNETRIALQRLVNRNERSMAAQLRFMIRQEAIKEGLWVPPALQGIRGGKGA